MPLPAASISVALAPIFAQPKSEKRLQRAESPTETLATQDRFESEEFFLAATKISDLGCINRVLKATKRYKNVKNMRDLMDMEPV